MSIHGPDGRLAALPQAPVGADAGRGAPGEQAPRYLWIREQLVRMIIDGGLKGGAALPSEGQLARHFGVALGTLRKAIDELVARNVVERVQGKGLFVAAYDIQAAMRLFRIVDATDTKQLPKFEKLLGIRDRAATANERLRLGLRKGEKVVELRRTRSFPDGAVMLETICLPGSRFADFRTRLGAERPVLLYDFYEQEYGVHVVSVESRLRAVAASSGDASEMGLSEGHPVLEVERVAFELDGAPVELRTTLCDTTASRHYLDGR